MEISEENESFAEKDVFFFDRLFDLHDHLGVAPDVVGGTDDFGAGGLVFVVGESGELAGMGFNQYLVSSLSERFHARGGDADPAFVVFHFL